MDFNNRKVLVLAPHTDDGELGLGGSINKMAEEGADVTYIAFSTAEESVPKGFPKDILKTEVKNATTVLGIKPENLIVYNYQVRKLNYVRQEILEDLIRIRSLLHLEFQTEDAPRSDDQNIGVYTNHPGTVQTQFKDNFPVQKRGIHHIRKIPEEGKHHLAAVEKRMNEPPLVIQVPADPATAILQR